MHDLKTALKSGNTKNRPAGTKGRTRPNIHAGENVQETGPNENRTKPSKDQTFKLTL